MSDLWKKKLYTFIYRAIPHDNPLNLSIKSQFPSKYDNDDDDDDDNDNDNENESIIIPAVNIATH